MTSRECPLPGSMTVQQARDAYLAENGFSVATYEATSSPVTVLGVTFERPLTEGARWAIRFHDLHHAITGYGTDLAGEAEVSAWEIRRGLSGVSLYVRVIIFSALLLGLVVAPLRTLRALFRGRGHGSLFRPDRSYGDLLALRLDRLRTELSLPSEGLAQGRRAVHRLAPRP